jgi:hypothetical protein
MFTLTIGIEHLATGIEFTEPHVSIVRDTHTLFKAVSFQPFSALWYCDGHKFRLDAIDASICRHRPRRD